MHFVRFFKIRRHFCQKFIRRNPDIYRKAELFPDAVFYLKCRRNRRGVLGCDFREIHIAFIHADLLDLRRKTAQIFHQHRAFLPIHFMIGRLHHKVRTLTKGIRHRFPGTNAVFFRRHRLRKYDAVARLLIPSDDRGDLAKILCCTIF